MVSMCRPVLEINEGVEDVFRLNHLLRRRQGRQRVLQFFRVCILQVLRGDLRDKAGCIRDAVLRNRRKAAGRGRAFAEERADAAVAARAVEHAQEAALVAWFLIAVIVGASQFGIALSAKSWV